MSGDNPNNRFLPFSECMNFRHMGGYTTVDGRKTRADKLFRSCIFELNDQADIDRFEALNIEQIFDFRMASERVLRPLTLNVSSPPDIIELDISSGNMGSYLTELNGEQPASGAIKLRMTSWYDEMATEALSAFQSLFRHLQESDGASLVLCNTGKDRSGMAAGLVLEALGVPEQLITEDYLLSAWAYRDVELAMQRYLRGHRILEHTSYMKEIFNVYPDYINAFRARARQIAGSLDQFIEQCLSVNPATIKDLRMKFTE